MEDPRSCVARTVEGPSKRNNQNNKQTHLAHWPGSLLKDQERTTTQHNRTTPQQKLGAPQTFGYVGAEMKGWGKLGTDPVYLYDPMHAPTPSSGLVPTSSGYTSGPR